MEAARERCCDELMEEGELLCGVPTQCVSFFFKTFPQKVVGCDREDGRRNDCQLSHAVSVILVQVESKFVCVKI
jgi:hypothetical protein